MLAGNTILSFGAFLNLAHSLWTHLTDMPIASAMVAFLEPFLFSATMYSTLDWSSFFMTRTRLPPI